MSRRRRPPLTHGPSVLLGAVLAATALAALLVAGCGSSPTTGAAVGSATASTTVTLASPSTASSAPATAESGPPGESEGARVFRTECAGCHGTAGQGELGPALVGVADRLSVAAQTAIVQRGEGRMPAFAGGLSAEEIAAVVAYTRTQLH